MPSSLWIVARNCGSWWQIFLSFVPPKILRRVFSPIVSGSTVFLIGASLVGVGLKGWAGGAGPCHTYQKLVQLGGPDAVPEGLAIFKYCPHIFGPGDCHYPWGDARWIVLGFFVFSIIVLIEVFGSPFLRNTQVMIGLLSGIILSAALAYVNRPFIDSAPAITFPLVKTFPLGFCGPALISIPIGYLVSTVETIGDVSASAEASRVPTEGEEYESRVHGGLLADRSFPNGKPNYIIFREKWGHVLTRTANRWAGLAAAGWLIL